MTTNRGEKGAPRPGGSIFILYYEEYILAMDTQVVGAASGRGIKRHLPALSGVFVHKVTAMQSKPDPPLQQSATILHSA